MKSNIHCESSPTFSASEAETLSTWIPRRLQSTDAHKYEPHEFDDDMPVVNSLLNDCDALGILWGVLARELLLG